MSTTTNRHTENMTHSFTTISDLAFSAIFAAEGKCSESRASALKGKIQQLLKTDGVEGMTLGPNGIQTTVKVDVKYFDFTYTVQFNKNSWAYCITNIVAA